MICILVIKLCKVTDKLIFCKKTQSFIFTFLNPKKLNIIKKNRYTFYINSNLPQIVALQILLLRINVQYPMLEFYIIYYHY